MPLSPSVASLVNHPEESQTISTPQVGARGNSYVQFRLVGPGELRSSSLRALLLAQCQPPWPSSASDFTQALLSASPATCPLWGHVDPQIPAWRMKFRIQVICHHPHPPLLPFLLTQSSELQPSISLKPVLFELEIIIQRWAVNKLMNQSVLLNGMDRKYQSATQVSEYDFFHKNCFHCVCVCACVCIYIIFLMYWEENCVG